MKRAILVTLAAAVLCMGCPKSPPVPAKHMQAPTSIEYDKIAVLPFVRMESNELEMQSPVSGEVFDSCPIIQNAEATLWNILEHNLDSRPEIIRVPSEQVRAAINGISLEESLNLSMDGEYQLAVAKNAGADAALFGFAYCFRERTGTAYASMDPASVGFNLLLVEVESGKLLWKARFEEQQQPLSENVLEARIFIERGAKFVSAADLAREGIRGMVEQLPSGGGVVNP